MCLPHSQNKSVSTEESIVRHANFLCSDMFLQAWWPSVRLMDVLSLLQTVQLDREWSLNLQLLASASFMLELLDILFPCLQSLGFSQFEMQKGKNWRRCTRFRFNSPSVCAFLHYQKRCLVPKLLEPDGGLSSDLSSDIDLQVLVSQR